MFRSVEESRGVLRNDAECFFSISLFFLVFLSVSECFGVFRIVSECFRVFLSVF